MKHGSSARGVYSHLDGDEPTDEWLEQHRDEWRERDDA